MTFTRRFRSVYTNNVGDIYLLIPVLGSVIFAWNWVLPADDALITHRYVNHFLEYGQPYFNFGDRVLGLSSPGYYLLLTGLSALMPLEIAYKLIASIAYVLTAVIMYKLLCVSHWRNKLLISVIFSSNIYYTYWVFSGMETFFIPLLAMISLWGVMKKSVSVLVIAFGVAVIFRPEAWIGIFPLVVTAFTAMLQEPFLLHGATSSTGGCAILIIINGPIRLELGMTGTFNALGSSDRATTVIGRAIRLILCNLLDARPGDVDRSTLGHPGKFSYCIAEDEDNTNWFPLAEERDIPKLASAVTVMAAGAPRQLMNEWTTDPEDILDTYIAEIKANMLHYSIWPGNYAIIVPPQLRTHFNAAGWSKADIRHYVYENARIRRSEWSNCGKSAVVRDKGGREYQALPDEHHLLVIAAGGPAGGFGAVIPPWFGLKSEAITMAVGACVDCNW